MMTHKSVSFKTAPIYLASFIDQPFLIPYENKHTSESTNNNTKANTLYRNVLHLTILSLKHNKVVTPSYSTWNSPSGTSTKGSTTILNAIINPATFTLRRDAHRVKRNSGSLKEENQSRL